MGALTLVITLRLAPLKECLHGLSNTGMLTIGALFMVAAGVYTTGAIGMVSEKLIGLPKTLLGCQLRMLPPVALSIAFMIFYGKRLLPGEKSEEKHIYHQKRHYRVRFTVEEHGHLVGKTFRDAGLTGSGGCELMRLSLDRGAHEIPITPDYVMRGGELFT
jgi:hypothetical protein